MSIRHATTHSEPPKPKPKPEPITEERGNPDVSNTHRPPPKPPKKEK